MECDMRREMEIALFPVLELRGQAFDYGARPRLWYILHSSARGNSAVYDHVARLQ